MLRKSSENVRSEARLPSGGLTVSLAAELSGLVDPGLLADALRRPGERPVAIAPLDRILSDAAAGREPPDIVVVPVGHGPVPARAPDWPPECLVVALSPGWIAGRPRVSVLGQPREGAPPEPAGPRRFLDRRTVDLALSCTVRAHPRLGPGGAVGLAPSVATPRGVPVAPGTPVSADEVRAAAAAAGLVPVDLPEGADEVPPLVVVRGEDPLGFTALEAGAVVLVLEGSALAAAGFGTPVPDRVALAAALAAASEGRIARAARDDVRRFLAGDILFGATSGDPVAVAAAIRRLAQERALRPPEVSIVVNNHNYRRFVGEAIESARRQTVAPLEIIVVDDGSTDGSTDLVRDWPGIVAVLKRNGGQASAFNAGMERASGDVVVFLDADDRLKPDAVETIRRAWRPGIARLHFGLDLIDADGRPFGLYDTSRTALDGLVFGGILSHGAIPIMPTSGNAFARWALETVLPMPEPDWRLCADLYLTLATAVVGRVARVEAILGEYRVHGGNRYFDHRNSEHAANGKKLPYHLNAWRQISADLPKLRGRPPDPAWRPLLARHVLHWTIVRRAGARAIAGRAFAALRSVAFQRGLGPALRLRFAADLAATLLRAATRGVGDGELGPRPFDLRPADGVDPIAAGGGATWPLLSHGSRIDVTIDSEARRVLGPGWARTPGGAALLGRSATLCIALADEAEDWMVRLDVEPKGPAHLTVRCNGVLVDDWRLDRPAVIEAFVPGHLLAARDGERLCVLEIATGAGSFGLCVTGLEVAAAPAQRTRFAPPASAGRPVPLDARHLGTGWDWPDGAGVRARAFPAAFQLSTTLGGRVALRLGLDGSSSTVADGLAITVNGNAVETFASRDGRHVTGLVEPWMTDAGGLLSVSVSARDGCLLAPGEVRVSSVRIDPAGPDPAADLVPDRRYRLDGVDAASGSWHDGFSPAGAGARPGRRARLRLATPPGSAEARALLFLATEDGEASDVAVSTGPDRVDVALGGIGIVAVPLRSAGGGMAEVVIEAQGPGPVLGWVAVEAAADPAEAAGARLRPGTRLSADELAAAAIVHPPDWHPPAEGALWLAGARGRLKLILEAGCEAVRVTALPLDAPNASLVLGIGEVDAACEGRGPTNLVLPAPAGEGARTVLLEVATTALLSLSRLGGAAQPAMIGGAVLAVAGLGPGAEPGEAAWSAVDRLLATPVDRLVDAVGEAEALALRADVARAIEAARAADLEALAGTAGALRRMVDLGAACERVAGPGVRSEADGDADGDLRGWMLDLLRAPAFRSRFMFPAAIPSPLLSDPDAIADYIARDPAGPFDGRATGDLVDAFTGLFERIADLLRTEPSDGALRRLCAMILRRWHSKRFLFGDQVLAAFARAKAEAIERLLAAEGALLEMPQRGRRRPGRLRLGVLVRDVLPNPEGWAVLGMYRCLDRALFEPILLALENGPDSLDVGPVFERVLVLGADTDDAVRTIRALDLDLLLLGAYSPSLDPVSAIVAHRLARVQVLPAAVCPSTLGFRSFDVALSCRAGEPPDVGRHYCEPVRWIEGDAQCCYDFAALEARPPAERRAVLERHGVAPGSVVLVSGAMAHKITLELLQCWVEILLRTPGTVLVLYPFAPNWWIPFERTRFRERIDRALAEAGLDPARIVVLPPVSPAQVRDLLAAADLYLDSFPYAGATTVCEALSLDLPVVTLAGTTLRGLTGASWARACGASDLVARHAGGYIAIATRLAGNEPERAAARGRLAAARGDSPAYFRPEAFGRAFSRALARIAAEHGLPAPGAPAPDPDPDPAPERGPGPAAAAAAPRPAAPDPARRVVVLAGERTGSTLLCNLLNEADGALIDYELFALGEIQYRGNFVRAPGEVRARDADPARFVDAYFDRAARCGVALAGFKLFEYHSAAALDRVCADPGVALVLLDRPNVLARFASLKIAIETDEWARGRPAPDVARLDFDPAAFARYLDNAWGQRERLLDRLGRHGRSPLQLDYPALAGGSANAPLSAFLGVPLPEGLPQATVRQNAPRILDRFRDPDAVMRFLAGIGMERWADAG